MIKAIQALVVALCVVSVAAECSARPAQRDSAQRPAAAAPPNRAPIPPAPDPPAPLTVTLDSEQETIHIAPDAPSAEGLLQVRFENGTAADIELRAAPLRLGDARGFLEFPADGGHDTVRLNAPALNCQPGTPCPVAFAIKGMWPSGLYEGTIEAWGPKGKIASTPVNVMRLPSSFHPVETSSFLHDGEITVDIYGRQPATFPLAIQNPLGSPPNHFLLQGCGPETASDRSVRTKDGAIAYDCPALGSKATPAGIAFLPSSFWLEPGATETVSVTIQPCAVGPVCSAALMMKDGEHTSSAIETVILVNQFDPVLQRQFFLLVAVILGSGISVILNNLFPTTRAKQAIKDDLRRAVETLQDCPNAGPAVSDALRAETTRLKLVLNGISFRDSTKDASLRDVRQATASVLAATALARRLSLLRADADGAVLSVAMHAALRDTLQEAEEAILAADPDTVTARLNDVQARLTQLRTGALQAELKASLGSSISKLLQERGIWKKADQSPPENKTPLPQRPLEQPVTREPTIFTLIDQLDADYSEKNEPSLTDLLDTERDFYIADVWTEYMERKLAEFVTDPGDVDGWQDRKRAWTEFSKVFLQSLRHNPKSDQTQTMLDLLRNDTMPQDIATALRAGQVKIQCSVTPKYLEPVDIAVLVTNPLLSDVQAVRRFIQYNWTFDDDTPPPPDVDHCRHYFVPARAWWPRRARRRSSRIIVKLSVPFTEAQDIVVQRTIEIRARRIVSLTWVTDWVSFLVTASIAVVTTFGEKYATSVPNVVGWPDYLTAFMLGFGLDQLRSLVNPVSPPPPPRSRTARAVSGDTAGAAT